MTVEKTHELLRLDERRRTAPQIVLHQGSNPNTSSGFNRGKEKCSSDASRRCESIPLVRELNCLTDRFLDPIHYE